MKINSTRNFAKLLTAACAFVAIYLASSCTTPKDITYFQDRNPGVTEKVVIPNSVPFKLQPGDRISIYVKSRKEELTKQFNMSNENGNYMRTSDGNNMSGYLVNDSGDINFPVLGKFHVQGLDRQQLTDTLETILHQTKLVDDAIVQVEYTGLYVTVLGQGGGKRINIDKDKMNFFEFLGKIGDIDLNAKHRNVLVTRVENGMRTQYEVDVTKAQNIYDSPAYYIHQNDIVYIEPSDRTKRQATTWSEITQNWGFWSGIAGMIISSIALVKAFK